MKIQLEGKSFGKKILFSDKNSFCKKKNSILKKKTLNFGKKTFLDIKSLVNAWRSKEREVNKSYHVIEK